MIIEKSEEIIRKIGNVLIGKEDVVKKVLMAVYAKGNVLLEDTPGVGKTTLALAFAKALGLEFKRVQFTPDTMPSDITGFTVYNKETGEFDYKQGAIVCNLFMGDEINRASAKTQSALLEAMEENAVTVDGVTHRLPNPFICIATQNPTGSSGTQPLPESHGFLCAGNRGQRRDVLREVRSFVIRRRLAASGAFSLCIGRAGI